jgi:hypothetical protein
VRYRERERERERERLYWETVSTNIKEIMATKRAGRHSRQLETQDKAPKTLRPPRVNVRAPALFRTLLLVVLLLFLLLLLPLLLVLLLLVLDHAVSP